MSDNEEYQYEDPYDFVYSTWDNDYPSNCREANCSRATRRGAEYCSEHEYHCYYGRSLCNKRVASFMQYCSEHARELHTFRESGRDSYNRNCCAVSNCSEENAGGSNYCFKHYYPCQQAVAGFVPSCPARMSTANTYCSLHSNSCPTCSRQIPSWNKTC